MNTRFLKQNKNSIIISIVIGVFLFYSQPLLTFIGTQIVNLFVAVSEKFSNYYYTLIAQNDPNLISDYISSIIVILLWLTVCNYIIEPYFSILGAEEDLKNMERKLNNHEDPVEISKKDIELRVASLKKKIRRTKTLGKSVIVIFILMFLYFSFRQGINSLANSKNVTFQNKLTILSVYLGDNDIKKLRASWAQIKSSEDYKHLMITISEYEEKYITSE